MQVSRELNTVTNIWEPEVLDDFKERVSYDANGNILSYRRNGNHSFAGTPLGMDSMRYTYKTGTNQLDFVYDSVGASNYENDIDGQTAGNYQYDAIGNLRSDQGAGIDSIEWTVYGKISRIKKSNGSEIRYTYDVGGNRISKRVNGVETWYVRDAAGNVMSIYTKGDGSINNGALSQTEGHLYGSSRLGVNAVKVNVEDGSVLPGVNMTGLGSGINNNFTRGEKSFELSNHLGNVLVTVLDRRVGISKDGIFVDHYEPAISSSQEYYPFGMLMPGRQSRGGYRYGFNGKEKSHEIKGAGNSYTAAFWEYDPRIGRRWNLDPKPTVGMSEYSVFRNGPIWVIDPLGDTTIVNNTGMIISNDKIGNSVYVHHFKDNTNSYIGEIGGKIDANEIFKNLLDENIAISKGLVSPWTFRNLVKNKGTWDLKKNTGTIYGLANAFDKGKDNKTQFSFQGELYTAQDLGNYHYGATGKAFYLFSEHTLLLEAGKAQIAAGTSMPEWQNYRIQVHNAGRGEQYEEKVPLPP
ncbi:hypothetical protein DXN04_21970 [Chitinophaga silvisoli]|uniref:Bacterial toxin 44 domain-containing protein n=2 Tax=Chitinophaga silvisoli TaxID=2291814 RepID=A0A3E1NX70_9BACT|nr:hypothetical protein DXN04_21970 [Chitinophaga silvisoli]